MTIKSIMILFLLFVSFILVSPLFAWNDVLTWIPPTTFADNITPLDPAIDIKGYRIYYGTVSGTYTNNIEVGNVTTFTVTGLTKRKYFFAVTTIDQDGDESVYSNEVWHKLKIGAPGLNKSSVTLQVTWGPK